MLRHYCHTAPTATNQSASQSFTAADTYITIELPLTLSGQIKTHTHTLQKHTLQQHAHTPSYLLILCSLWFHKSVMHDHLWLPLCVCASAADLGRHVQADIRWHHHSCASSSCWPLKVISDDPNLLILIKTLKLEAVLIFTTICEMTTWKSAPHLHLYRAL